MSLRTMNFLRQIKMASHQPHIIVFLAIFMVIALFEVSATIFAFLAKVGVAT